MSETQQIIGVLGAVIAVLVWVLRSMARDAREANTLTMANAAEFTKLVAETRLEADVHQTQRVAWEREGRELRATLDAVQDRVQDLEQGCVESDAQLAAQSAEIATLKVNEADLRRQVTERDERIARLETRIAERDKQIEALTKRIATMESENGRLMREEAHWKTERAAWVKERAELLEERKMLEIRIAEMMLEIEALKRRGTGPLPSLDEVMSAQPEPGQEPSETTDETPAEPGKESMS